MQMDASFFISHYAYTRWATAKTLEAVDLLTQEELHRPLGNSYGSVFGTLVHIFEADRVWLRRLRGEATAPLKIAGEKLSMYELKAKWAEVLNGLDAIAAGVTPETVEADVKFRSIYLGDTSQTTWKVLLHVVNHATYHRGQITTMLRQMNHKAVSTDLLFYYAEKK
jgi:uncharacterized damage-inducible protein DinB